jgi:DtxR family Mn-dependent transcriptional regulator
VRPALQSECVEITISKENYLKAIAEAQLEGRTGDRGHAQHVGSMVSAPAVTMAIKRLKRDHLIRVGKEGQITLSAGGRKLPIA